MTLAIVQSEKQKPGRKAKPGGRRSPEYLNRQAALDTYCQLKNADLNKVAQKHGVSKETVRYWVDNGKWLQIRRGRRELYKTLERVGHPRKQFEAVIKYVLETFQDLQAKRIRAEEGKANLALAKQLMDVLQQAYENLGIRYKNGSNQITAIMKEFDSE